MATPSKASKATKPPLSTSPTLSSLYIYNPTLGQTDSTVSEQLIFHYPAEESPSPQSVDRQLRAIGLAQGIIQFARAFSPGDSVCEVRTLKGFSVPVEVERNWWMLAVRAPPEPCLDPVNLCVDVLACVLALVVSFVVSSVDICCSSFALCASASVAGVGVNGRPWKQATLRQ